MRPTLKFTVLSGAALALALVAAPETPRAEDYNQRPFLAPQQMSKIQRVITHGRTERARQEQNLGLNPNQSVVNTDCGKLSVGNVETSGRPGQRAPRENIVVAREIINAPINCGTRSRVR